MIVETQELDWLTVVMRTDANFNAMMEADTKEQEEKLAPLNAKLDKLEKELKTWKAKSYKANNSVWTNRDEEPVATYGQINERRKAAKIRNINREITKVKNEIHEVEYN